MNKNPSPKTEFLLDKEAVKAHARMVESPEFQRAIEVSVRSYVRAITDAAPPNLDGPNYMAASAACFGRIQGMMDFVALIRNLGEEPTPPTKRPDLNLKPTN